MTKNWDKHKVSVREAEAIFFNEPLLIADDVKHSISEKRFFALGKNDEGRKLFAVFTVRGNKIRIISVRDMNKKERAAYDKKKL